LTASSAVSFPTRSLSAATATAGHHEPWAGKLPGQVCAEDLFDATPDPRYYTDTASLDRLCQSARYRTTDEHIHTEIAKATYSTRLVGLLDTVFCTAKLFAAVNVNHKKSA